MLKFVLFLVSLVFVFVFTFFWLIPWVTEFMQSDASYEITEMLTGKEDPTDRSDSAVTQCKRFVAQDENAPGSARAPDQDHKVYQFADATYVVKAVLEGGDGYTTTVYNCTVRFSGADESDQSNWKLVSIVFKAEPD